jgi:hypothetical protein
MSGVLSSRAKMLLLPDTACYRARRSRLCDPHRHHRRIRGDSRYGTVRPFGPHAHEKAPPTCGVDGADAISGAPAGQSPDGATRRHIEGGVQRAADDGRSSLRKSCFNAPLSLFPASARPMVWVRPAARLQQADPK